ncbi:acyl-CoA synthetase family protein [Salegentibacter mishustinae]|uniref:hypothetical protein n=1 Tax=Salegentibacter mishustinae TaxID=270918 RepID=UPI001473936F|nr:hypothetical protein [Salegentibacter mishustinae]
MYYIFCLILREPISYFQRRKLAKLILSDWNRGTKFHISYQKREFEKVKKTALKLPFYKKLLRDNELKNDPSLKDFPVIEKSLIKQLDKQFKSSSIFSPRSFQNTGGSTGNPFYFFTSPHVRDVEFAHQNFFFQRINFKISDLIYTFNGTKISKEDQQRNKFWLQKRKYRNFPFGSVHFSATLLTEKNASHYIDKILTDKPAVLRGYPSTMTFLAEQIIRIGIQNEFSFLKGIMLTSEVIYDKQIEINKKAFNCQILPQYGMTESACFAFTYPNKLEYYCSPFYGITEVLNENNESVQIGEIGEIVVTSLSNHYQPFIRYRTGDLARYGGKENGFVILKEIFGRTQDYIVTKWNKKIMLVSLIFGAHLKAFEGIDKWQLKQTIPGEVNVRITPNKTWNKNYQEEIIKILSCNNEVKVVINFGSDFETTKSGKQLFMIQHLK